MSKNKKNEQKKERGARHLNIQVNNPLAGTDNPVPPNARIHDKYIYCGTEYYLYQSTYELKMEKEERWILEFNEDKIRETIEHPDCIYESNAPNPNFRENCNLFYKEWNNWISNENGDTISIRELKYLVIVIDIFNHRIITFYPSDKIKKGEKLWPI